MAANPQTKPNDLGCESAGKLLPSTSGRAEYIIYASLTDKSDLNEWTQM